MSQFLSATNNPTRVGECCTNDNEGSDSLKRERKELLIYVERRLELSDDVHRTYQRMSETNNMQFIGIYA